MGVIVRMNPLHAPALKPIGAGGIKHMASQMQGDEYGYLGHFQQPQNLMAGHNTSHPGFKAVEAKIAKQKGIRNPGAVLAASSRNASAAAHRKNPRLNRVKG